MLDGRKANVIAKVSIQVCLLYEEAYRALTGHLITSLHGGSGSGSGGIPSVLGGFPSPNVAMLCELLGGVDFRAWSRRVHTKALFFRACGALQAAVEAEERRAYGAVVAWMERAKGFVERAAKENNGDTEMKEGIQLALDIILTRYPLPPS